MPSTVIATIQSVRHCANITFDLAIGYINGSCIDQRQQNHCALSQSSLHQWTPCQHVDILNCCSIRAVIQPQQNLRLCHIVVDHLCKVPVFKQNRDDNMIEAKHDKAVSYISSCHISCSCHMRMVALQSLIYKHVLIFCVAML